jgi:hypothetical protein
VRELLEGCARGARATTLAEAESRLGRPERRCGELEEELHRRRRELAERDALLDAVLTSRSWQVGHTLKKLFDVLRGQRQPTAAERWRSLRDC